MKLFVARFSVALAFLVAATVAVANPLMSKSITGADSALVITVPDDHFLKITNFTQVGGTDRGVVAVTLTGDDGGSANVLSATRIDLSTGSNSQNFPEIGNRVIITGPANVTVQPVAGATLFSSYRKDLNEGAAGGGGGTVTPIPTTPFPILSPTPGVTPTPTATATVTP